MKEIRLNSIGELSSHSQFSEDWFVSQKIPIPFLENEDLTFLVVLDDKLVDIDNAIKEFLRKDLSDRNKISHLVFQNYKDFVEAVGDGDFTSNIEKETDIWRYVYPVEILVERRHRRDKSIYVSILCECDWEIEHGLQIVFRQGKKVTRVSSQDGHLTEADAWDKPDEDDELLAKF